MKTKTMLAASLMALLVLCLVSPSGATVTLLSDGFNTADSYDINSNVSARQSGTLAPISYVHDMNWPSMVGVYDQKATLRGYASWYTQTICGLNHNFNGNSNLSIAATLTPDRWGAYPLREDNWTVLAFGTDSGYGYALTSNHLPANGMAVKVNQLGECVVYDNGVAVVSTVRAPGPSTPYSATIFDVMVNMRVSAYDGSTPGLVDVYINGLPILKNYSRAFANNYVSFMGYTDLAQGEITVYHFVEDLMITDSSYDSNATVNLDVTPYWDKSVQRAGRDEIVSVRLENPSLNDQLQCNVQLTVPAGLTLLDPAVQQVNSWTRKLVYRPTRHNLSSYTLEKNRNATVSWRVRASAAFTGDLQVTVSGAHVPTVVKTLHANLTDAVNLAPASYVPEPATVTSPYYVGATYWPGWKPGDEIAWGWSVQKPYPLIKPALGYYDESSLEVMDWQIKFALEHGINFFNICWNASGAQGHAIDALLNSQYKDRFKFAVNWCNAASEVSSASNLMNNQFAYWMNNYFKNASYLKIDNKPVVFVYGPFNLVTDLGGTANVSSALQQMRAACVAQGFAGLWVIGEYRGNDSSAIQTMKDCGFDASWSYCWPEQIYNASQSQAISDQLNYMDQRIAWNILPSICTASVGWNPVPWETYMAYPPTDHFWLTPASYQTLCSGIMTRMNAQPAGSLSRQMVLLDNWNEWGEGHYIMPHREYGFGYLDAVRATFGGNTLAHTDLIPEDVALGPYDAAENAWEAAQAQANNVGDNILGDTTPPSTPGTPVSATGTTWGGSPLTFNWAAATDAGSGVSSYNVQIGTTHGGSDLFNSSVRNVLSASASGSNGVTYYCRVRAIDNAGNISSWSANSAGIIVDAVPPTGSIVINPPVDPLHPESVTLTLSASDVDSGISKMMFSSDGVSWSTPEAYATTRNWTLTDLGDGKGRAFVHFIDRADNLSPTYVESRACQAPDGVGNFWFAAQGDPSATPISSINVAPGANFQVSVWYKTTDTWLHNYVELLVGYDRATSMGTGALSLDGKLSLVAVSNIDSAFPNVLANNVGGGYSSTSGDRPYGSHLALGCALGITRTATTAVRVADFTLKNNSIPAGQHYDMSIWSAGSGSSSYWTTYGAMFNAVRRPAVMNLRVNSGSAPEYTVEQWKKLADGTTGKLTNIEVTVDVGDSFFVETTDRSIGIRIAKLALETPAPGTKATITGAIQTNTNGERYIVPSAIDFASGSVTITPLGTVNKNLGGGNWFFISATGAGQRGVLDGTGLNDVGLLVKAWGKPALAESADRFTIDDGSGKSIEVRLLPGATHSWNSGNLPAYVKVTGACGLGKRPDNTYKPVIYISQFVTAVVPVSP